MALVRWDRSGRWVPHSTSSGQAPSAGSGQALRGRRDVVRLGPPKTAGRLTMNGRGWGTEGGGRGMGVAWDVFRRLGECVQFWGRCVQFSGECVQFLGGCVQFRGGCVHFGEECVQFLAGRPGWGWGADGRRDSSFGKLRTGRFGGLRTGRFGRLAMNARGVGSQGCGPGFDLTGRG